MSEPEISAVIPVFNEVESLPEMHRQLTEGLSRTERPYEILYINDGCSDGSDKVLDELAAKDDRVGVIHFRRNFGKSPALAAGFGQVRGRIVLTLDADLQDDPAMIHEFVARIEAGADLVSGWKQRRHDPLGKTMPSKLFNAVVRRVSGVPLRDFNCGFKAYRIECIRELSVYGGFHRFLPVLAGERGFKIEELVVNHRARQHGVSKYGIKRFFDGLLDLLRVLMVTRYRTKPVHFFGIPGLLVGRRRPAHPAVHDRAVVYGGADRHAPAAAAGRADVFDVGAAHRHRLGGRAAGAHDHRPARGLLGLPSDRILAERIPAQGSPRGQSRSRSRSRARNRSRAQAAQGAARTQASRGRDQGRRNEEAVQALQDDRAYAPAADRAGLVGMKTVVQRVSEARVRVDDQVVGEIGAGVMVLVGVERGDSERDAEVCANKVASLRLFPGKTPMDQTLADIHGSALVVSQFTLAGSVRKGRRPSFDRAEDPPRATELYEKFCEQMRAAGVPVQTGRFGAHMKVELVNDGPVTLLVSSSAGALL